MRSSITIRRIKKKNNYKRVLGKNRFRLDMALQSKYESIWILSCYLNLNQMEFEREKSCLAAY